MKTVALGLLILFALPTLSFAADAENGALLSRQCSVCHGKDGIAKDPEVANLAGQSAFYLEKSLKDFQKGMREDRRMTLIVQNLSDDDIKDLAAWYASFKVTVDMPELAANATETEASENAASDTAASETTSVAAAGDTAAGEKLYKKECRGCHGPTAKGLASYPKLIGHPVEYLVDRLKRYRSGEKFGPNTPLMAPRAKKLSDDDIVNISNFIVSIQ